jgi:4a-hydroxytetrahydrobiopterin dehydratase
VQKVAEIAEGADHHPDITINYTRVTFSCSTHDAGGVTDKDFKLADNIEIAFNDRDA